MGKGMTEAVELLGDGQMYLVEGVHPSGVAYAWAPQHPCVAGPPAIPRIKKAQLDKFFTEVANYRDMYGFKPISSTDASNATVRTGLDNPKLWAPSPEAVLELLKKYRPEHLDHDSYVQNVAAIKASLGPRREEFRGQVLEWSPGVRSTEDDQFEIRWNSITNSALGWEWLLATARGAGYHEDAQQDFADTPDNPNAQTPETPYDRMLERYVWVRNLGQYNDTEDGSFLDSKNFNAANVEVKPFGSSGQQSAEATFQNAAGARKVATATSQPGKPVILDETNDRGIPVRAVNLWRPSLVSADPSATTADVAPWLDLVDLLFGADTPERKHFLT